MSKQAPISVGDAKYTKGERVAADVLGGVEGTITSVGVGENYATRQPVLYYVIAATVPFTQGVVAEESKVSLLTNGGKRKGNRRRTARRTRRMVSR